MLAYAGTLRDARREGARGMGPGNGGFLRTPRADRSTRFGRHDFAQAYSHFELIRRRCQFKVAISDIYSLVCGSGRPFVYRAATGVRPCVGV